jgi:mannosyltransferase
MATATSLGPISADSPKAFPSTKKQSSGFVPYSILLTLVTVLAVIMRLHALTAKSFWLDEGISINMARLSWSQFLQTMWSGEANMTLYYLFLRFWLTIGSGEGFIRGLSVLFSVAAVPCIFFLGARLFGRRVGLLAAFLFSVNAYDIRFAQEARSYTMVVFFAVLATWLLARNLQESASAHWGIYAAVCALATYSHLFGALLVPAHAISLLSWRRDEIPWRKFVGSLLMFGVMVAPIAIFLFAIFVLKTGAPPTLWFPPLQPDSLLVLGVDFSGVYGLLLLYLDVLAVGIAALGAYQMRRGSEPGRSSWGYTLLFSWLVAPVVMVLAVSLVKPIFVPRFLIFCLPALLLLVAVGISKLRPPVVSWGLFAAISVCSILGAVRYYRRDFDMRRQDWRAVTTYVFNHAQPGDSIFFFERAGEEPFEYYSRLEKSTSLRPKTLHSDVLQSSIRQNPPSVNSDGLVDIPGTNLQIAPPVGNRVWLVLMFLDGSKQESDKADAVGKWLSNRRQQVDVQDFTPLRLLLFDRAASSSPPAGKRASVSQ